MGESRAGPGRAGAVSVGVNAPAGHDTRRSSAGITSKHGGNGAGFTTKTHFRSGNGSDAIPVPIFFFFSLLGTFTQNHPVCVFSQANLPLLQRELLHCARLAKQNPAQYLAQHEQLLLDTSTTSPVDSSELLLDVNENGKRRTPDRWVELTTADCSRAPSLPRRQLPASRMGRT